LTFSVTVPDTWTQRNASLSRLWVWDIVWVWGCGCGCFGEAGGLIGAGVGAVVGLGCGACDFGIVGCVAGLRFPSVLFCFGSRGVCGTIAMPLKRVNWNRLLHEANMAMVLRGIEALKATASSIANTVNRPPKPVQAPTFKRLSCLAIPTKTPLMLRSLGLSHRWCPGWLNLACFSRLAQSCSASPSLTHSRFILSPTQARSYFSLT